MDNNKHLEGHSLISSDSPENLVFLLHGYGDNAENFISLAQSLKNPSVNINFFAPNAPSAIHQYPTGREWFNLYPNGINFNQAGPDEKEILKAECIHSVKLIKKYIKDLCVKYKLTFKNCFIVGFSQGAMIAFETGKYINDIFAGCILLSGRILPSSNYNKKLFNKTPLLIIHGDQDTVIEPHYFQQTTSILENHGYFYESHLIKDLEHSISPETIQIIKNFLKKNV